ncbi:MAG: trigger factor [Oscillospiraceae bacterium]|nr:trigger factor [Oscillospiraceae bacterium]
MEIISQNNTATNTYEIEFTFSAEEFEAAVNTAFNKRKKSIAIPGFRKGKATRKMIEAHYGEGVFYEDAVNHLYNTNIVDVVEKTGLDVVDIADTQVVDVNKETGVQFKATIIVKPEVKVSDYKGLEVKKTVKNIDDDAVNAEIDKMRSRNARIISVEDRATQLGDTAVIDFDGYLDGEAFEGGKGEKFPLELGSNTFIPGFEDQVVGKNIGEEFDVNVTFPENYQAENLKGKAVVFKCKLHEIKGKDMPELDDEFVKDVSEFDTVDELKADLKTKLEKAAADNAEQEVDNALVDAIIEKLEAEVPEVMYERRINDIAREWSTRNRIKVEDYLKYTGITMEQFRASFKDIAKKQVDLRLALEAIADAENIEVTAEDIEKEYAELAEQYKMDVENVKTALPEDAIKGDIRIEKALEVVRDNAKIEEVTE